MKIVKIVVQVCVPDAVSESAVTDSVYRAAGSAVGVLAVECGSDGGAACAPREVRERRAHASANQPAKRRYRRRVNANGETCEIRENADGTVTETRT